METTTTDARRMLFCISGVQGLHSAHEAIAYYYRGHYIYAAPGNPVVPLPFPTKGKLLVSGVTADCAPAYDRGDRSLVPEQTIGHLHWARLTEEYFGLDGGRSGAVSGESATAPATVEQPASGRLLAIPERVTTTPSPTPTAHTFFLDQTNPTNPQLFTPHDRAQYLAASAPGSRIVSRAPSPNPYHNARYGAATNLRPVNSATRLNSMLAEAGQVVNQPVVPKRSRQIHAESSEWMSDDEIEAYMASHGFLSPPLAGGLAGGLANSTIHKSAPSLVELSKQARVPIYQAQGTITPRHPGPIPRTSPKYIRKPWPMPTTEAVTVNMTGKGRSRKGSIALNEAYNTTHPHHPPFSSQHPHPSPTGYVFGSTDSALTQSTERSDVTSRAGNCVLHGEDCDGVTTTGLRTTERARQGMGFRDLYPVVEGENGGMIDWARILREVKGGG